MEEWIGGGEKVGRRDQEERREGNHGQDEIRIKKKDIPSVFPILVPYITISSLLFICFYMNFRPTLRRNGEERTAATRYIQEL